MFFNNYDVELFLRFCEFRVIVPNLPLETDYSEEYKGSLSSFV